MLKEIRKADIILFTLLIICAVGLFIYNIANQHEGGQVIVTVDGKYYSSYSLEQNQEIEIASGNNINVIVIENGFVHMESSTCHNQVCVNDGKIHTTGQSIICLPNKVVITIEGAAGSEEAEEIDAISR